MKTAITSLAILSAASLVTATPAMAAGLTGSIGFGGNINVTALGQCRPIGSPNNGFVDCTAANADQTRPLTTLDFQDLSGISGRPTPPYNGEAQVSNADGDFGSGDPPPTSYIELQDLFVNPTNPPTPTPPVIAWARFFYDVAGLTPDYELDLLTLGGPLYTTAPNGTTTVQLSYTARARRLSDGAVGIGSGALSGDITQTLPNGLFPNNANVQSFLNTAGNTIQDISWSTTLNVVPEIVPVPESSNTLALLGLGLGSTVMMARKKMLRK